MPSTLPTERTPLPTSPTAAPQMPPPARAATKPEEVHEVVQGYPHTELARGRVLHNFIREYGIRNVLELGVNHGVGTCYAAAAVASLGGGMVVAVDLYQAAAYQPGVLSFAARLGLADIIVPFFERETYNWRLRAFLGMSPRPSFDLVLIDGAHTWEADALAFLLTDHLLRPGGWWIFDDINWSIGRSPTQAERVTKLSIPLGEDEIASEQVRDIVDLLVKSHPSVEFWREDGKWGFARKRLPRQAHDVAVTHALRERAEDLVRNARAAFPLPIQVPPDLEPAAWQRAVHGGLKRNAEAREARTAAAAQESLPAAPAPEETAAA